jgi:glutamate-1-semialdehyde 2,1-aminomutase
MTTDHVIPRTEEVLRRASELAPGGVHSCRRRTDPALAIASARGAYLTDVDGRQLIDYHAAYGAILLGHCFPTVVQAVTSAIGGYDLAGVGTSEAEIRLAEKLVQHVPCIEQVLFCGSGSEATYHAVRLARATTGRRKVLKFQGCYHGFHDYVLPNALTAAGGDPDRSAGALAEATEQTLVCRYNDLDGVQNALRLNPDDIACVLIEPFAHNPPSIEPKPGFLAGLRSLCDANGIVLIFDEVITGFRHHLGGYQAIAGVVPDLATFAKAMGNGFPVAAIGGKRELMQRFNTHHEGDVFYSGTYNGNAASVAAALATIEALETEPVHDHIFRLGERMRTGLAELAKRAGVPALVTGFGSLYVLLFMEGPLESNDDVRRNDAALYLSYKRELLRRGVLEMPAINALRSHVSYSHSDADVDFTLEVAEQALSAALDAQVTAPRII